MLTALHQLGLMLSVRLGVRDERGATMVEYGLIVAFIALVVAAAAITLGGSVSGLFEGAADSVDNGATTLDTLP